MMMIKERSPEWADLIRRCYPVGSRVQVDQMEISGAVPHGMCGTVTEVDDVGRIHAKWDVPGVYDGLCLISGRDYFHGIGGAPE